MGALSHPDIDEGAVLGQAVLRAGRELGLTQQAVKGIIGKDPTTIRRKGLDPRSKSGELALLLIRVYRSLYALVGGDRGQMRHWLHTRNRDTGGVPADQMRQVQGLCEVVAYLDALRGRP